MQRRTFFLSLYYTPGRDRTVILHSRPRERAKAEEAAAAAACVRFSLLLLLLFFLLSLCLLPGRGGKKRVVFDRSAGEELRGNIFFLGIGRNSGIRFDGILKR